MDTQERSENTERIEQGVETLGKAARRLRQNMGAVARGDMTPAQAGAEARVIDTGVKLVEGELRAATGLPRKRSGKRGTGAVYLPRYRDAAGNLRESATWWIVYHVNGKRYRESARTDRRSEAVKLLQQRTGHVATGRTPMTDLSKTTFADLERILLEDYEVNRRRSLERAQSALKHLRPYFGHWRAISIMTDAITGYVRTRQQEGAMPGTINRELAVLKRSFRLAKRAGKVADAPYIPMLEENNARQGFYERPMLDALLRELPAHLKPLAECAYITGWRLRELTSRQRRHLDLEGGWLILERGETKNGEPRRFPIGAIPRLRELLVEQIERTEALERATGRVIPYLFHRDGHPLKDFWHAWTGARSRAGLRHMIFHDFRRSAIRNLVRAGISERVAMELSGHKTRSIFQRYNIIDEGDLEDAGAKLAAYLEKQDTAARKVVPLRTGTEE